MYFYLSWCFLSPAGQQPFIPFSFHGPDQNIRYRLVHMPADMTLIWLCWLKTFLLSLEFLVFHLLSTTGLSWLQFLYILKQRHLLFYPLATRLSFLLMKSWLSLGLTMALALLPMLSVLLLILPVLLATLHTPVTYPVILYSLPILPLITLLPVPILNLYTPFPSINPCVSHSCLPHVFFLS